MPFGFALTDPGGRISRTRLFQRVTRGSAAAPSGDRLLILVFRQAGKRRWEGTRGPMGALWKSRSTGPCQNARHLGTRLPNCHQSGNGLADGILEKLFTQLKRMQTRHVSKGVLCLKMVEVAAEPDQALGLIGIELDSIHLTGEDRMGADRAHINDAAVESDLGILQNRGATCKLAQSAPSKRSPTSLLAKRRDRLW